jgi:hypothetical protein
MLPDLTRGKPARFSSPTGTPSFVPAAIAGLSVAGFEVRRAKQVTFRQVLRLYTNG